MEKKYKLKIVHLEGLGTVTKTVSSRKKRAGQLSTEFHQHHTIFTNGHVPFLFAWLPLTTASFFLL